LEKKPKADDTSVKYTDSVVSKTKKAGKQISVFRPFFVLRRKEYFHSLSERLMFDGDEEINSISRLALIDPDPVMVFYDEFAKRLEGIVV